LEVPKELSEGLALETGLTNNLPTDLLVIPCAEFEFFLSSTFLYS
jgi:hypothetical protein